MVGYPALHAPPLRVDRAMLVEDVSADSDDDDEEEEITDSPLQCHRARMITSRSAHEDDNLAGGVTTTPASPVDGSAVGDAGSCVTTSIAHHASPAASIGGRSVLQRGTCVGGTSSPIDGVHGSTAVGGSSTMHNNSSSVPCSLAIGWSSIVDGGVALGVALSDGGAGCPGDTADVPAGKASADLDVNMSDAGGECHEDTTTTPAADVFASLIPFISPEDCTISPSSSPLQTDNGDSNPRRGRLSNDVPCFNEESTPSSTAVHSGMSPSDGHQPVVVFCARISRKRMSPPKINQEVVRTVKSMAGRKKGSKNQEVSNKMDVAKEKDKSKKKDSRRRRTRQR
ncbi:hypothetical protein CBR_g30130 [Chara braunii]|uniref:Uncharacterized protein n=1 Tax=Chara braunii TaxID=69332 RepID=A0A388LC11_CHABU|nr:hypothetical protein CBR_g30130 [Chara braunii]|eukprot:GBG79865.1 hypothetical protein CBR_g30130 [Chara braunii]